MDGKRTLLGLAAAATFALVSAELLSLAHVSVHPLIQTIVLGFVSTAIGAYIARRDFMVPARCLWLAEWMVSVHLIYVIAAPTGQASVRSIVRLNLWGMALSAVAVVPGALLGQALARRKRYAARAI